MGQSPFDHYIYVIASDGDIEEGVTSEASSLAGVQQLGNLIVFYDDNKISIEHDTTIALGEDTAKRYEAYGWHVQVVEGGENVTAIEDAVANAKAVTDKPSFIVVRTIIAFPAPTKMNTGEAHGSALGAEEVAATKEVLGFDPDKNFEVSDEVIGHTRQLQQRGRAAHLAWDTDFDAWAAREPERKALLDRLTAGERPPGWDAELPSWEPDGKGVATRKASGAALAALGATLPELWGGSADLAGSNNTTMTGADSFGPTSIATKDWNAQPYGRTLHFGVREHAMAAILNGIVLHGPTRAYGGTFLQFADYMRPAVRIASLMNIDPIYVWTHDSIGLGEDGPTHQPVEHLAALRAIPNLAVVRPADANETVHAWRTVIERSASHGPAGLVPDPPGRPGARGHQRRRRRQGRLRAGGFVEAAAGRGDHRDGVGGAARGRRPRDVAGPGCRDAGGVDAVRGVVRKSGAELPRRGAAPDGTGPGRGRGRCRDAVVQVRRRPRRDRVARTLRRIRRLQDPVPRVRVHPRGRRGRRAALAHRSEGMNTMTQNANLAALSAAGVSVWLDDLSRERIKTGNLADLIATRSIVGVTTNPTIFQGALSKGHAYDEQVHELAARNADVDATIRTITTDDVRDACDIFAAGLRIVRRQGRPRLHRGGSAPGPRHRQDGRAGHRAVEDRRPAQPADQDPCHRGRYPGDREGSR